MGQRRTIRLGDIAAAGAVALPLLCLGAGLFEPFLISSGAIALWLAGQRWGSKANLKRFALGGLASALVASGLFLGWRNLNGSTTAQLLAPSSARLVTFPDRHTQTAAVMAIDRSTATLTARKD